jgi:hypothetical protein
VGLAVFVTLMWGQVLNWDSAKSLSVAVVDVELRVSTPKLEKHEPARAGNALRLMPPSKKALIGIAPPGRPPFGVYCHAGHPPGIV